MTPLDRVREFVVKNLIYEREDILTDEMSFYETGLIDSLGIVEIIDFLEKTYNVVVEDEELIPENLGSISNIVKYVGRKLSDNK